MTNFVALLIFVCDMFISNKIPHQNMDDISYYFVSHKCEYSVRMTNISWYFM